MSLQQAVIAPPTFLEQFSTQGDIHLVLAHLVLRNSYYREFYLREKKYKILDNGAFELRKPMHADDILEAATLIGANEVVAPDVFDDGEASYELTSSFLTKIDVLDPVFRKKNYKFKIMAVPHGKDYIDWLNCFRKLYDDRRVDVIGIGYQSCKVFEDMWPLEKATSALRAHAVQMLSRRFTAKPIHLLGGGSNPIEVLKYEDLPNVRSIDTSLPFLCGQHGIFFSETTGAERPAQATLDLSCDDLSQYQMDMINANIQILQRWVRLGKLV